MTGNNPNLDLVNINAYIKFGEILSICSQNFEQERNSDINQKAITQLQICNNDRYNSNRDLVNINAHTKFVLKILSRNKNLTSVKGQNSITNVRKKDLDLVSINAHTKFGQILLICSRYSAET